MASGSRPRSGTTTGSHSCQPTKPAKTASGVGGGERERRRQPSPHRAQAARQREGAAQARTTRIVRAHSGKPRRVSPCRRLANAVAAISTPLRSTPWRLWNAVGKLSLACGNVELLIADEHHPAAQIASQQAALGLAPAASRSAAEIDGKVPGRAVEVEVVGVRPAVGLRQRPRAQPRRRGASRASSAWLTPPSAAATWARSQAVCRCSSSAGGTARRATARRWPAARRSSAGRASTSSARIGSWVGDGRAGLNAQNWWILRRAAGQQERGRGDRGLGQDRHAGLPDRSAWTPARSAALRPTRAAELRTACSSRTTRPCARIAAASAATPSSRRGSRRNEMSKAITAAPRRVSSSTRQACTPRGSRSSAVASSRPGIGPLRATQPASGSGQAAGVGQGAQPGQRVAVEADHDRLSRRRPRPAQRGTANWRPDILLEAKPIWRQRRERHRAAATKPGKCQRRAGHGAMACPDPLMRSRWKDLAAILTCARL